MTFSASARSSSGRIVTGSADITVLTRCVFGSLPAATPRMTMSRSVTIPTRRPSSTTGIEPQSSCFMSTATSPSVASGSTVTGAVVMSSRTFMRHLRAGAAAGRVPPLGRSADLEDLGPADGADSLGGGPSVLHLVLLRVLYLRQAFAFDELAFGQPSTPPADCLFPRLPLPPCFARGPH